MADKIVISQVQKVLRHRPCRALMLTNNTLMPNHSNTPTPPHLPPPPPPPFTPIPPHTPAHHRTQHSVRVETPPLRGTTVTCRNCHFIAHRMPIGRRLTLRTHPPSTRHVHRGKAISHQPHTFALNRLRVLHVMTWGVPLAGTGFRIFSWVPSQHPNCLMSGLEIPQTGGVDRRVTTTTRCCHLVGRGDPAGVTLTRARTVP